MNLISTPRSQLKATRGPLEKRDAPAPRYTPTRLHAAKQAKNLRSISFTPNSYMYMYCTTRVYRELSRVNTTQVTCTCTTPE